MSNILKDTELILNSDGSVFHLHLHPEQIANTVLLVGDQNRVEMISEHFDHIDARIANREFFTHTGTYKGKRITALSTGIGTDNIDIVVNELDAAVNIDLEKRVVKETTKSLNLIRIGTCGAIQEEIPVGSFVASKYGLGMDTLMRYYDVVPADDERRLEDEIEAHAGFAEHKIWPYARSGSERLLNKITEFSVAGITATACGFYGPQGRELRIKPRFQDLNERLGSFRFGDYKVLNFEMETSALFGVGKALGHECATVCAVIGNRYRKDFIGDYNAVVGDLISKTIDAVL